MKMRTLKLSPKFLIDALQGKAASIAGNLPADVELIDLKFDVCHGQVLAVVRSDNFDDVAELYPIPEFKLAYAQTAKPAVQPASAAKAEPATAVTVPKTVVSAAKPAQPKCPATKLEGEFSPDQRKLLSFKVEGDYVIVKPTSFLKEEWGDINEVVRSLGGKWVKGDIISFWQIPVQQ